MRWLDCLRHDKEAYHDYLVFLDEQKNFTRAQFDSVKDLNEVLRIKGRVEAFIQLELHVTEQEREDADAADRAAQRERDAAGPFRVV